MTRLWEFIKRHTFGSYVTCLVLTALTVVAVAATSAQYTNSDGSIVKSSVMLGAGTGTASMNPWDATNSALQVNCVVGCSGASVSATVTGNIASGATDSGNPLKMGSVYHASPITVTDGQRVDSQADAHGTLKTLAVDLNGNPIDSTQPVQFYENNSFVNITTNATTVVKSGAGSLIRICLNTKGATANTATVYDNTAGSGTKLATIDTTSGVVCLPYGIAFATGLTVVTATGTAPDMTVVYR